MKVVVIAHLYGTPGKVDEIRAFAICIMPYLLKMLQNRLALHIKADKQEHSENITVLVLMEIRLLQVRLVECFLRMI